MKHRNGRRGRARGTPAGRLSARRRDGVRSVGISEGERRLVIGAVLGCGLLFAGVLGWIILREDSSSSRTMTSADAKDHKPLEREREDAKIL